MIVKLYEQDIQDIGACNGEGISTLEFYTDDDGKLGMTITMVHKEPVRIVLSRATTEMVADSIVYKGE